MLKALLTALQNTESNSPTNDPVSDHVSDPVKALLQALKNGPLSTAQCMSALGLSHRPTFRKNYLRPAFAAGLIERTIPEKPNSRLQKYRISQ